MDPAQGHDPATLAHDRSFEDGIDRPAVQLIGTPAESPTAAWALATATTHDLHPVGPGLAVDD